MQKTFFWVEEYLFYPKKISQKVLSYLLLPFSAIYCIVVISKRFFAKEVDFDIPIVSIGNLTVGGNGKTPFLISLTRDRKNVAVILRGYKRESSELLIVDPSMDIKQCGDEAMLYAKSLPNALIIVSKDRIEGIKFAKKRGVKAIFLDDAFHKSDIKKFDIVLKPRHEPTNSFCLPSGGYREPKSFEKYADIVAIEERDFKRVVKIKNESDRMVLITAIAKPKRLDEYLPKYKIVQKIYFEDHHFFSKKELEEIIKKYGAATLLVTTKDLVKIEKFNLPLSILELNINIDQELVSLVDDFIDNYGKL